jgi:hypothetical protein
MGIKFANSAFATLAAGINSSVTSITLTTGQGARFPSLAGGDYFFATLIDTSNNLEIVKCTARSTDVLTVVRGQESTTARSYSTGDRIEIRITAQTFLDASTPYPSQTGNAGEFLRTDGTNVSWEAVTPTSVSDQANSSTGYFDLPAGTTAQRPGSPAIGMTRYNTTLNLVEAYHDAGWIPLTNPFTAEGGNSVTTSGSYKIHTFTSSGTFAITSGTKTVEYLVVAGGGGGGRAEGVGAGDGGGGGGAGGMVTGSAALSSGSFSVTVGGGGGGMSNGGNSSFNSLTAIGGGRGGTDEGTNDTAFDNFGVGGGSGGGAASSCESATATGGSGTAGQGNAGGNAFGCSERHGAGGGGAGAAGSGGNLLGNGDGGSGAANSYSGSSVTYAGGGGGGGGGGAGNGAGGSGGGAAGGNNNATANTGGGGGGSNAGSGGNGGNGGSGIVIIRYLV